MDTGWSDTHVLYMPAIRFFALKKAHTKIRDERLSQFFIELVDIVGKSGQSEDSDKQLKSYYRAWTMDEQQIKKIKNPKTFDIGDDKDSAKVVSVFSSFARYMRP